jgi:hypothetical protein
MPKLTIGTTAFDNYAEVWFTVQALRMYHDLTDSEILVIDNFGDDRLRDFIASWGCGQVRYIRDTEKQGTAYAKGRIFNHALGDWVLVLDSHVLLGSGVVERFRNWAMSHDGCRDLLHGPMLYDDFVNMADSMSDTWSGSMWGVWNNRNCRDEEDPYIIAMHGMGLFACRRDAWLGFNPEFRGFGGEEGYIHQKYRNAGRQVLCLPWLKWLHKFNTIGGVCKAPYAPQLADIIHNYKTGFAELGMDPAPIYENFNLPRPISNIQIDVNHICGAKCWYCPAAYIPRPPGQVMPIDLFEKILDGIVSGKASGTVSPNCGIWLCSYNDFLLDPLLEQRLEAMRSRGLTFPGITNAIGLESIAGLVDQYRDVIGGWSINLPAGDAETYARYTGNKPEVFARIIAGISKLRDLDPEHYGRVLNVNANGMNDQDLGQAKGIELAPGENDVQVERLRELLPGLPVRPARSMCDRAGLLAPYSIDNGVNRTATGCNNGGDRAAEWFHVNSFGEVYLCCCDYEEKSKVGDLRTEALDDVVRKNKTAATEELRRRLCDHCLFAKQ